MRVISASQPLGGFRGFAATLRRRLATAAERTAGARVLSLRRKPGKARTAASPSQAELGNRTPAARSGDAHPTIQSGGTAVSTTDNAAVHGRIDLCRVQQS